MPSKNVWQFLDKFINKGLMPLAVCVGGPLAGWVFSTDISESKALLVELEKQRQSALVLEEKKAVELSAMSAIVVKLDKTLEASLIQAAALRVLAERAEEEEPDRTEVLNRVRAQMVPNIKPEAINRVAGKTYDGWMKTRKK